MKELTSLTPPTIASTFNYGFEEAFLKAHKARGIQGRTTYIYLSSVETAKQQLFLLSVPKVKYLFLIIANEGIHLGFVYHWF